MIFAFNDDAPLCRICSDPDVFYISWRIFKNINFFLFGAFVGNNHLPDDPFQKRIQKFGIKKTGGDLCV